MSNPYQPYAPPTRAAQPEPVTKKHSIPGILSTVFGLLGGMLVIVTIGLAIYFVSEYEKPNESQEILLGFGGLGAIGLNLIGVTLGIVGLVMPNKKKVFAFIGCALNGLPMADDGRIDFAGLVSSSIAIA